MLVTLFEWVHYVHLFTFDFESKAVKMLHGLILSIWWCHLFFLHAACLFFELKLSYLKAGKKKEKLQSEKKEEGERKEKREGERERERECVCAGACVHACACVCMHVHACVHACVCV